MCLCQNVLQRRKKFVAIRQDVKQNRSETGGDDDDLRSSSVHYLTSQYLSQSSLSEEVSQFDFSASTQAFSQSSKADHHPVYKKIKLEDSATSANNYIVLEMDQLNQHECTGPLTALIQHMAKIKITPSFSPDKEALQNEMPQWMTSLHKRMDSSTNVNVRLFLTKVILNTEEVFKPFAKFWLKPLTQLIVSGCCGKELNFFVTDLILMLLSWATVAVPENTMMDRSLTNRLLEFLMSNVTHTRRDVLRHNLEIVNSVVECWKDRMDIPSKIIYNNMKDADPTKTNNKVGIQLLGTVVANGLPPYTFTSDVDKDTFFQSFVANITYKYKDVYAPCAEVAGMIFKYMSEKEEVTEGAFHDLVHNQVELLHKVKKYDQFITVVHKMQKYYLPAAERYTKKILFLMPGVYGSYRIMCLEIIQNQVEKIENIFVELKTKQFIDCLTHRHEGTQVVALQIINKMLTKLSVKELLYFLPQVTLMITNRSDECRKITYDILMWIYDAYKDEADADEIKTVKIAKEALLQGLADSNFNLRLEVNNFWSHATRLPTATLERTVALLQTLYSTATEQHFLSYATYLLLERTSQSPDYQRKIFDNPLSDCQFQKYDVNSAWNQRYSTMNPVYGETLASLTTGSSTEQASSSDENLSGHIRATQDALQFTPTQDQGERRAFNWLTQTSVDTFASSGSLDSTSSTLMFSIGQLGGPNKRSKPRTSKASVVSGGGQSYPAGSVDNVGGSGDVKDVHKKLRQRFLRDTQTTKHNFARQELFRQKIEEEQQVIRKKRREAQVTMYRNYRIGDLPDIEISYSALIAPLQALAQRDDTVAKLLFTSLLKGIFSEMDKLKSSEEVQQVYSDIKDQFCNIIRESSQYFPSFIASLLEISYHLCGHIRLDLEAVTTACLASKQQDLGIVLFEQYLTEKNATIRHTTPARKRARLEHPRPTEESVTWLKLAELYKSVDNLDVVRAIFTTRFGSRELSHLALSAEAQGDYSSAVASYKKALECTDWPDGQPEQSEVEFWEDSFMQCLNHLANWSSLDGHVVRQITDSNDGGLQTVWESNYQQEHYLPFLMRSKLKLLLSGKNDQSLLTFVDSALINISKEEQKVVLENRYSEELALLYIIQGDYDRASHYNDVCLERFLQDWSSISALSVVHRRSQLQQLQKLSEMKTFLKITKSSGHAGLFRTGKQLLQNWNRRLPTDLDFLPMWDDIVSNRKLYLEHLESPLASSNPETQNLSRELFEAKFGMTLSYSSSATKQGVVTLATRLLKDLYRDVKNVDSHSENRVRWFHAHANTNLHMSSKLAEAERIKKMLLLWKELDDQDGSPVFTANHSLHSIHCTLRSNVAIQITEALESDPTAIGELDDGSRESLKKKLGMKKLVLNQIIPLLLDLAFKHLQQSALSATEADGASSRTTSDVNSSSATAHLRLAVYCDKQLRNKEDDLLKTNPPKIAEFPPIVVESVLEAMKLGNAEALHLFPRLLQIVELYPETIEIFQSKAELVPSWMYILWISQMVAILDKPEAPAVQKIILTLAKDYPQALVYPFKLSCEGFKFDRSSVKNKDLVQKVQQHLEKIPLVDDFIRQLDQLSQAEALFCDKCINLHKLFKDVKGNQKQILDEYKAMWNELFVPKDFWGTYRTQFVQKYGKIIEEKCGKNGSKLLSLSGPQFYKFFWDFVKARKGEKTLSLLKDYSHWLDNFKTTYTDSKLEIPGQYTGKQKPIPEHHVKIAGFDYEIQTMPSIRKPKRIKILGNDEREYKFLVKGGEDLRLDQRIEQLFDTMNTIYSCDPVCGSRRLCLTTYQVIPLTPRIGLLQWVEQTTTLRGFMESYMTDEERNEFSKIKYKVQKEFIGWQESNYGGIYYESLFMKCNRKNAVEKYYKLVNDVKPANTLRNAFLKMSSSVEAFLTLRNYFITSHALVSVSQYILGIGDRHLSNFMVSQETGCVIGIDFGHAFGSATQILSIPELLPFRLSPQLLSVMEPFRESGLFKAIMIHALAALRNSPDGLLNTMDIFIKEPSLDWQDLALRQKEGMEITDDTDTSWYPKQKIDIARKKLLGWNPAQITKDELETGRRSKAVKSYVTVTLGDKENNVRARLPPKGLSVEQQVECLIDQATDPNILGRTFVGWDPWI